MTPEIKSRKDYLKKLNYLNKEKICGFCNIKKEFIIKEFKNWIWVFSEFPYWKYNTIIISKKHKTNFSELTSREVSELKDIFVFAENSYKKADIVKDDSTWGMDILWRQRAKTNGYETRSHIHIHLCPQPEGRFNPILDNKSHKIKPELLISAAKTLRTKQIK